MLFMYNCNYNLYNYFNFLYFWMMDKLPNIDELRAWFYGLKEQHRWTYRELSELTDYTESGIREAFKNNTLSYNAIAKIINSKNLSEDYFKKFIPIYDSHISTAHLLRVIAKRKHELFEDILFKEIITSYCLEKNKTLNPK